MPRSCGILAHIGEHGRAPLRFASGDHQRNLRPFSLGHIGVSQQQLVQLLAQVEAADAQHEVVRQIVFFTHCRVVFSAHARMKGRVCRQIGDGDVVSAGCSDNR